MSLSTQGIPDHIELVAGRDAIAASAEWIDAWTRAHGLDQDRSFAMRLCVEEAVTNIVSYAYDHLPAVGKLALRATLSGEGALLTIMDDGRPFDVAAAADVGREGNIASATVGGRGIRLMRRFSERMDYARIGGRNRLSLTFLTGGSGPDR